MIVFLKALTPREEVERLRALVLTSGGEVREVDAPGHRLLSIGGEWPTPPVDLVSRLKASSWTLQVVMDESVCPLVQAASGAWFGERGFQLIAGPCTVEDTHSLVKLAVMLREAGATMLRGGAYKPTTSPYSFAGNGSQALESLRIAKEHSGLPVVTEALSAEHLDLVCEVADMIQIGARNMQNFDLLRAAGRREVPVLLKRGMGARIDELLSAAEYIMSRGNTKVALCERGIRTFENTTRATLDISAVPALKTLTDLPIVVDPSHAAGERTFVPALALAATAAGADGLLIEVHEQPEEAIKDGAQTISTNEFRRLSERVGAVRRALQGESATLLK